MRVPASVHTSGSAGDDSGAAKTLASVLGSVPVSVPVQPEPSALSVMARVRVSAMRGGYVGRGRGRKRPLLPAQMALEHTLEEEP